MPVSVEHSLTNAAVSGQARFNFSKAAVMVVDRNAICLKILTGILAGFGFKKIRPYETIKEAAAEVSACPVDLIFIDPEPFKDEAYDFVRWLRADKANDNSATPIIMATGYTPLRQVTATRQCGADFIIAKPFSTAIVLSRLLWVAENEARRGMTQQNVVSATGSGVELW
jgi:DNA-binding response OmpR family regulator